jgi:1-acyl-sn-glycerol-3-phosphate acyltransferase
MRRLADRFVRLIARTATLGWFRAVEVTGLERVPRTGPVLLVANHHGGFVDPALLLATVPRPVHFVAMASLFRILPLRPLLALAGAIPVHRAQDAEGNGAEPARNVDAFAACFAHLRDGGAVGIFPEGQASDEPHLLPVRTGAARIALGAHARGAMGIRIVPVGLIYEDKQRARSRAYVRVGAPIALDEDLATNPGVPPDETDRDAVIALTRSIEERLADASLDFQSAEQRSALRLAANVALRWEHADPRGRPPVGEVERLADRLADATAPAEAAVRAAAVAYREGLAAAGVHDAVVAPGADEALARRSRTGWMLTLVLSPLAVVGLLANAVPTLLVYAVGRRSMPPVGCFAGGCSRTPPSRGSSRSQRVRSAASRPCGASGGFSGRGGRGSASACWLVLPLYSKTSAAAGVASSRQSELRHRRPRKAQGRTVDMTPGIPRFASSSAD